MDFPRPRSLLTVGLVVGVAAACAAGGAGERTPSLSTGAEAARVSARAIPTHTVAPAPDAAGVRWIEETLASLRLEEKVAQLVFPWISGAYWADDDPELLEALRWVETDGIGGVVISIGTPLAYAAKLNALQDRARVPLLVTSDFENGGPGMRIAHLYALPTLLSAGGGTSFPPTMAFGAVGDEGLVERFAEATAREARALGVHVIFAPVLDVNSNPENPIINTRAFGEDPEAVGRLGAAFIRGARAGGALTTAKHFPGHGDTRVDSHLTLPEVTADRARLDAVEFPPFRAGIAAGVDGIMTAHVSVPGVLGPDAPPATLSSTFMTQILRNDLGFGGIVYTDALRMGAITEAYGAGEAAVLAMEAGADVILIPASVPEAIASVAAAVRDGRISEARLDASVRRVLGEKARVGLHTTRNVPLEAVSAQVGIRAHAHLADSAAARSMTLVRDEQGLLPASADRVQRVLSITWAQPTDLTAGREFEAVMALLLPGGVTGVRVGPDTPEATFESLRAQAAEADRVLLNVYLPPRAGAGSVALPEAFRAFAASVSAAAPTVLVSFGNPYLLAALPQIGTYLVAWGDREVAQRAAAHAVTGAAPIGGRLPISIPPLHPMGAGMDRAEVPEMVARTRAGRGDALDEAGLVRRREPGVLPPDSTTPDAEAISPQEVDPARAGMNPDALARLDRLIEAAIADSVSPGVALAVGRGDQIVRLRGYGRLDWDPSSAPVTPASIYDLASLTKVVATTSAIFLLEGSGALDLDDPVVRYLPGWDGGASLKAQVTIRDLLLHRGGLPPFERYFVTHPDGAGIREAVYALALSRAPGDSTVYSDIGFKTLGWVVEAVSGESLDAFLESRVFLPLGMADTGFTPLQRDPTLLPRIAPTEVAEGRGHVRGEVHDENAWVLGGVAGHAGLFSSAEDLARLTRELAGAGDGVRFPRDRFASYTRRADEASSRALGWDTPSGRSSAGDYFSMSSFGHTGFTGTSIWIDPELDVWVVLLTNRVNPSRENARHIPFRRTVHDGVAAAIVDRPVLPRDPVQRDPS
jgi:beta-N-acetylhexosaminidase